MAALGQQNRQRVRLFWRSRGHPDEDVGLAPAAQAVVELGDHAPADGRAELAECSGPLGDRHPEQGFARLAEFGALGDEAEAVEVHVGAGEHGDQRAVPGLGSRGPRPQPGDRQCACRLHQRARIVEDVLDGRADLVVRYADHFLNGALHQREGQRADLADGDAVREDADVLQADAPPGGERLVHGVRLVGLDADHLDVRADRLDVARDARDEPAAAHGHEDRVDLAALAAQNLEGDGALARDHEGVVEGVHEDAAGRLARARRTVPWRRCNCRPKAGRRRRAPERPRP